MASSAGAAHMVHLCSIWATPWEQYEIRQCQSQTLCSSLHSCKWCKENSYCYKPEEVHLIQDTSSNRGLVNKPQIIWLSEMLENCRPGWKSQCVVQGVYGTASSQGAAWHCTGVNTCLLSRSWEEHGWWRLPDRTGKFRDISLNITLNAVINSWVGWKCCQVQLELVLSWAAKWAWCSDRALQVSKQELCSSLLPHDLGHLVCDLYKVTKLWLWLLSLALDIHIVWTEY